MFKLGDHAFKDTIPLTCTYFEDINSAKWAWVDPFTNQIHQTLPNCEAICQDDPPLKANVVRSNWTRVCITNILHSLPKYINIFSFFSKQTSLIFL